MIVVAILALWGCSGEAAGGADDPAPFAGVLVALDRDHDGVVREPEYTPAALLAPPFAEVDRDGDDALSAAEVQRLVLATDPLRFDVDLQPRAVPGEDPPAGGPGTPPGGPPGGPPGTPPGPPPGGPRGAGAPGTPPGPPPRGGPGAMGPPDDVLFEALAFEVEEVRARAPGADLPSQADLRSVARHGLDSDRGRAVVARLREAAAAAGLTWPETLGGP